MTQARGALPTPTVLDYERTLDRRARRAKSDGIDAELLLRTLLACYAANRVCAQWFRRPLRPMKTPADVCGSDRNSLQSGFAS
jgi:hypothetical protein